MTAAPIERASTERASTEPVSTELAPTGRPPRLRLRARSIAVGALAAVGVVVASWVVTRATRVLGWVIAAAVLAALMNPVVEALARRMRRGFAVALVVLGVVVLVGVLAWAGVGDLQAGLSRLRTVAPEAAGDLEGSGSWIGDAAQEFELRDRVEELLDDLPARLAGGSPARAVQAAASRGIAMLITLVLTIFLIGHGPRLVRGALRQVPEDRRATLSVRLHHAYRKAWLYVSVQLVKAVLVALLVLGLARAVELPAPAVLGLVAGGASVVPKLGIALGALPVVLLAGVIHGGGTLLVAAGAVFGLQVADALVVARWLEPASVPVGPAISLAALLLGTSLYGVGGGAIAIVLAVFAVAVAAEHLPAVAEAATAAPPGDGAAGAGAPPRPVP
jgi:predicted PurR-regulated permease PerM